MKRNLDASQPLKRINSKEELLNGDDNRDDEGNPIPTLYNLRPKPHPALAEINRLSSRDRVWSSGRLDQITISLMNDDKRKAAIEALEKTFSAEGLKLMVALLDWECMEDGQDKENVAYDIVKNFIEPDDVCLPAYLRQKIISSNDAQLLENDLREVKRIVLNDLSFNKALLKVLNE